MILCGYNNGFIDLELRDCYFGFFMLYVIELMREKLDIILVLGIDCSYLGKIRLVSIKSVGRFKFGI